jgi:2-succinyl-5-enolpyruvyl-6-hydroxy-3-cyclohexene-1-carboxylate synthase
VHWRSRCEPLPVPADGVVAAAALDRVAEVFHGSRGVVLAGRLPPGDPAAAGAARLAGLLDCPLVADPLSGLRTGPGGAQHLTTADALLRDGSLPTPEWCLGVGAPPVSRLLGEWTGRAARRVVVTSRAAWQDPTRSAEHVLPGDPAATLAGLAAVVAERGWRAAPWPELAARQAAALDVLARLEPTPAEAGMVSALARELSDGAALFIGNSLVVRDFDRFLPWREAALSLYANRGVSGIDGNVATAAGLAAGLDRPVLAVVGDVALFHDLNSLWLAARHGLVVLVINNGGGAIFAELPQAALP